MTTRPGLAELPAEAWNHVDCGLCGSAERELEFTDGPFSVVTCRSCGLTYVTPRLADAALIETKMRQLRKVGVPYTDEEIAGAKAQLDGKTELDAVIAYLQVLGTLVDFASFDASGPNLR